MTTRSIVLFDLPLLYRYRDEALALDGTRALTRGNPLGALGLMHYLNPARHIYTVIADGSAPPLVGGITHTSGRTFAKLLFLAPLDHLEDANLPALLDDLARQAGHWGALHILAEIAETSNVYSTLRTSGFSVYAWQRMWDISNIDRAGPQSKDWKRIRSVHKPAVQSLYYQIVPPLLHPIEPLSNQPQGLIFSGEVNCYVSIASGANGIVLTPLIHPEVSKVGDKLSALLKCLPERHGRKVYLCVRSYQAWLEPVLADLGALATERQAVMVKHLARLVKEEQTVPAVPSGVSVQPSRIGRINTNE